ncbi:MAG: tetratricopeptide repeat protein [bacterium]|nr:hypothetical protein [Betaproteobacteria bacterium]
MTAGPATGDAVPPARAAPGIDLSELSLEPIVERQATPPAPAAGANTSRVQEQPMRSDRPAPPAAPAVPTSMPPSMPTAAPAPSTQARTAGGPTDRRSAPRWSGDLQDDERAVDLDAAAAAAGGNRNGERGRRRAQERADASPARAGAVLAAGAGAARAGTLSRITRVQWILAGGLLAGVLLFAYFYIQISYPGLLQRGFRQPALVSPLASRTPPSPGATSSGTLDPGKVASAATPMPGAADGLPAGSPAAGSTPAQVAASPRTEPQPGATSITGVPPASPVAAPAAPAGVPAALAASPLLSPPAQAESAPATPAARNATNVAAAAAPASPPARVTGNAPPAPTAVSAPATTAPTATTAAQRAGPATDTAPPSAQSPGAVASAAPGVSTPVPGSPRGLVAPARPPSTATTAEGIRVTRGSAANPVNPALADAYDHLQAGRIEAAQRLYEQVAAADPRNVDALLGMGAVAQLGNQVEVASRLYMRVLELEPRNAHAQAALIGQLGRADPVAAESQLKTLIAREPSPFLYFTLGNLYADQNRWAQAQQAWFQAHHLQPGNADYAFNLAVGLERIAQPRLAIDYLRTAIRLADAGARANFDVAAARKRVALLESAQRAP